MTGLRLVALVLGSLLVGAVGAGCGGAQKAYIPADSPLREWEPPDEDELLGVDDEDVDDDEAEDDAEVMEEAVPSAAAPAPASVAR